MVFRLLGWMMLAVLAGFVVNNYLVFWQGFPGVGPVLAWLAPLVFGDRPDPAALPGDPLLWSQVAIYGAGVIAAIAYVVMGRDITLRGDAGRMSAINTYFIRACFWAVLSVGLADMVISFLRVEGLLAAVVGADLTRDLGRSAFRGAYVHMPLIGLSFVLAGFSRGLGFIWLALLVVVAELMIVIGRFVFSYEQAFMADLVRFWYAALFLFASAYTLLEEGHVRVDILYAGLSRRWKGLIDAVGAVCLGMALCWTILVLGTASKSAIINSPLLVYEVTQAGFGLYVKYLMAGFLGVFAVSMMIQFTAAFLSGIADFRGDPGHVDPDAVPVS